MELEDIFQHLLQLSQADRDLIEGAYAYARKAHEGQMRKTGKPYITHPFRVALILAKMRLDAPTIAAAFLHDTVEDCDGIEIDDIERAFGQDVARLVLGVTKMKQLPKQSGNTRSQRSSSTDRQAEYLRQIFMAMGNDVRVILVKLADRLDNMRTLGAMSRESQMRNARETMDIFAPLANRLGIGHIKWQLEDLAFRYLNPEKYREIAMKLDERRIGREQNMMHILEQIETTLAEHGIEAQVMGRPKHIYSIYRKMVRKQVPFDQVFDVRAVRVMVKDVPTCYQVLGIIHSLWRPIHGEFDDYIAAPKPNGYRSLHTAIRDDEGKTLEVQIRTFEMHQDAEYGIAAHWKYKESYRQDSDAFEDRINFMRRLLQNASDESEDDAEFVESVVENISPDRIYVFTPRNDIIDLPIGATPIDFAYHIHTEVGHRCRGAKVNGKMVGLNYQLATGERVEIITANRGGPSLDWLNPDLGYVQTHRARSKIRQWFRKQNREKNIALGRESLERELKRMGMEGHLRSQIAEKAGHQSVEHMLAAIGFGDVTASSVVTRLVQLEQQEQAAQERDLLPPMKPASNGHRNTSPDQGVDIVGTGGLLVKLAACCHPAPGDPIIGFVTRTSGVTVHRQDCKNIVNTTEPERLIDVSWSRPESNVYPVPVEIKAHDRGGLMRDIGAVIAEESINMTNVTITTSDNHVATFNVVMEVAHISQLVRVLNKIDMLPEVIHVRRVLPSEKLAPTW